MSKIKPPEIPNANNFKIPDWAGKPPAGLHLDVLKDGKLIQKLMIDEKSCYLFGRNRQLCDFPIDHQSCSRIHGALVWHKDLHRPFLIDHGSVHGTFIGSIRLEAGKPQQIPIDSKLHFGASTRIYVVRERIANISNGSTRQDEPVFISILPEDESELDNLTEFNTAQNRRNTNVMNLQDSANITTSSRRLNHPKFNGLYIHFSDQEEIINPEDVDPTIGRFRNLVQETFIPNKKARFSFPTPGTDSYKLNISDSISTVTLNKDQFVEPEHRTNQQAHPLLNPAFSAATKLGLPMPNLAAEVTEEPEEENGLYSDTDKQHYISHSHNFIPTTIKLTSRQQKQSNLLTKTKQEDSDEPRKKKYAKEAWPGKKPVGYANI